MISSPVTHTHTHTHHILIFLHIPDKEVLHLVTSPPRLGNDLGHLVHLSLRTAKRTESLLRQLARALVLAVPQQFDDAALIWGKARDFADNLADELGAAIPLSTFSVVCVGEGEGLPLRQATLCS